METGMSKFRDVYIIDGSRTPFLKARGMEIGLPRRPPQTTSDDRSDTLGNGAHGRATGRLRQSEASRRTRAADGLARSATYARHGPLLANVRSGHRNRETTCVAQRAVNAGSAVMPPTAWIESRSRGLAIVGFSHPTGD